MLKTSFIYIFYYKFTLCSKTANFSDINNLSNNNEFIYNDLETSKKQSNTIKYKVEDIFREKINNVFSINYKNTIIKILKKLKNNYEFKFEKNIFKYKNAFEILEIQKSEIETVKYIINEICALEDSENQLYLNSQYILTDSQRGEFYNLLLETVGKLSFNEINSEEFSDFLKRMRKIYRIETEKSVLLFFKKFFLEKIESELCDLLDMSFYS